ncbi:hypothetical protein ARMGADRAFT_133449 [Armillaria gallica]|uniref:Uncharacterized protein n=1 Tax=Armillaria gallica TaxID=47427 RepID=A0A2H3DZH7_ARMGA|nr:hypothetical protein ARMGADRAFT_133449 [Armillaria gallica]
MRRLLSSLPCSEIGMLKSFKLMHNGSASTLPNLLEWKKAITLHTLHIHMYTVLPIQYSHLVILEGCPSPDRPAGGWGLSCILVPFFNVERTVLILVATIKTRDTIEATRLTSLALCISILSNFVRIISTWVIPPPPPFVCSYILGNVHWQCRRPQAYRPICP